MTGESVPHSCGREPDRNPILPDCGKRPDTDRRDGVFRGDGSRSVMKRHFSGDLVLTDIAIEGNLAGVRYSDSGAGQRPVLLIFLTATVPERMP